MTEGPWIVYYERRQEGDTHAILPAGRPGDVAAGISDEEDAFLIAAAPDLLAACEKFLECWSVEGMILARQAAEAAVAKARRSAC